MNRKQKVFIFRDTCSFSNYKSDNNFGIPLENCHGLLCVRTNIPGTKLTC